MFTGIIQTVGEIVHTQATAGDMRLRIDAKTLDMTDVKEGDSIAVNGVCLTVTELNQRQFTVDVSQETLTVTTGLNETGKVNLEKALRLDDRLGGHLVSGHVDGVGEVIEFTPVHDCWLLAIKAPHAISKYIARKGSICVDGVSLTINTIEQDTFTINIIPHTLTHTTLGALKTGSPVNLEVDQIARYVERMQAWENESI